MTAGLDEMPAPDAAKVGIVADQVGELAALLDQVAARKSGDLLFKVAHAQHLAQNVARVIKAQCLVEVRSQQVMFARSGAHDASPCLSLMSKLTDVQRQTGELRHPRRVIVFHPIQNGAANSPPHFTSAWETAPMGFRS